MTTRRLTLTCLFAGLLTAIALLSDPWLWRHVQYDRIYEHDWGRLLRVMGSLVLWVPLALALWLELRVREGAHRSRAWMLLEATVLAGLIAELLKLLIRRERPGLHEGAYFYRSFADRPLDTHDIGFPSSHVMVAFAGAAALSRWYPRAGLVAYGLATGCAATRLLARAHFASDLVAAAIAGWAVATWLVQVVQARSPSLS